VAGSQAVFLDDIPGNLRPAETFGISTILVREQAAAVTELQQLLGRDLGHVPGTEKVRPGMELDEKAVAGYFSELTKDSPNSMFRHLPPRCGPQKEVEQLRPPKFDREARYGMSDNRREIIVTTDEGVTYYPDVDTEIEEKNVDHYTILGDDPTSAEAVCTRSCSIIYAARTEKPIKTLIQTRSVMRADSKNFLVTNTLSTKLDGVDFFSKTWKEEIPRNGV